MTQPDFRAPPTSAGALPRRPYRPPIGIPATDLPRRRATVVSVLLHVLVFALILAPPIIFSEELRDVVNGGAGGPGAPGGGGGGNKGTGGGYTPERLQYLSVQRPAPAPEAKAAPPVVAVPRVPPPPKPEPPKPEPPKPEVKPTPVITPPIADASTATTKGSEASVIAGTGGGSGRDGSAGSGSGSGGGVGSGVGTGRGSGNGPGTGGGNDEIFPPTVISLPLLPLPVPQKVRPYKMIAYFEVDTTGHARLLGFNLSKDSGYNRRIREMLLEIRFRAAVRKNGIAVLDTAVVSADAP